MNILTINSDSGDQYNLYKVHRPNPYLQLTKRNAKTHSFITAIVECLYIDCSIKKRKCRNGPESSQYHKQKMTSAPDFRVNIGAKRTRNLNS